MSEIEKQAKKFKPNSCTVLDFHLGQKVSKEENVKRTAFG